MDSVIDDLWETLMKEWLSCYDDEHDDEARTDITSTLSNSDAWKDPRGNFLLRLVSDDRTGYRSSSTGKWKPRVQLALAYVRHMSKDGRFADFIRTTLSARGQAEDESFDGAAGGEEPQQNDNSSDHVKNHQSDIEGIRLINLCSSDDRRGMSRRNCFGSMI